MAAWQDIVKENFTFSFFLDQIKWPAVNLPHRASSGSPKTVSVYRQRGLSEGVDGSSSGELEMVRDHKAVVAAPGMSPWAARETGV